VCDLYFLTLGMILQVASKVLSCFNYRPRTLPSLHYISRSTQQGNVLSSLVSCFADLEFFDLHNLKQDKPFCLFLVPNPWYLSALVHPPEQQQLVCSSLNFRAMLD
jgi:hypothetical protein